MKMTSFGRSLCCVLAAAGAASIAAGCGVDDPQSASDLASVQSEIIGGSAVSVTTRRNQGLVGINEVEGPDCSGFLIHPDWVVTAAHCLNYITPTANWVRAPRPDTTIEARHAAAIERVGASDLAIVQLAAPEPGSNWPQVTRTMSSANPFSLVGQTITCYGRGFTAYDTPDGLTGLGIWRNVSRTVQHIDLSDNTLVTVSNSNFTQTVAPGDSGGPCLHNGTVVAVASRADWNCADESTDETCRETITQITASYWRTVAQFKTYIDSARQRPAGEAGTAGWLPFWLDEANGWTAHPLHNVPSFARIDNTVHLRGGIQTGGTNMFPFRIGFSERPTADVYVPVDLCDGHKGRLWIHADGWVEVQHLPGEMWAAGCLTSLDGASYTVNNSQATNLALTPGWVTYSRPAAVRLDFGIVRLQGAISGGTNPSPFSLAGWQPSGTVFIPVDLCNATKGRLWITNTGSVSIEAYGGAFGNASCFTSLEGVSYATDPVGYDALTLKPGWVVYDGGYGTRAPKVANVRGIIRFQGAIRTSGTNAVAFTLPAKYRPATDVAVPVDLCNADKGRLFISASSGDVSVQALNWGSAQCFTSLEGAWFGL